MMSKLCCCLLEDPGAASYLMPVCREMRALSMPLVVWAHERLMPYLDAENIVDYWIRDGEPVDIENDVALFFCGTSEDPNAASLHAIKQCQFKGITSLVAIDGPANVEYRLRGTTDDPLAFKPDYVLVENMAVATKYQHLGMDAKHIYIVGHPQFDQLFGIGRKLETIGKLVLRKRLFPNLNEQKKLIVFCTELSTGLNSQQFKKSKDYTFVGLSEAEGRTEIVLEEVLNALDLTVGSYNLIMRLHPKNTQDDFAEYYNQIDGFSQKEKPYELLYASDLVIGLSSVILYEAAILGCRTLSVLPRQSEREWLGSIATGLTECVHDRESLFEYLRGWKEEAVERRPRKKENFQKATEKIIEIVQKLIG